MPDLTCAIDGCETSRKKKSSYCSKHRTRISLYGSPNGCSPKRRLSDNADPDEWTALFAHAIDRLPGEDGCWTWNRYLNKHGYGMLHYQGKTRYTHRVSYMTAVGDIPTDMTIDHLCFTPACVRPSHLRLLTHFENSSNQRPRVLSDECPQGHPFDEANTYIINKANGKTSRRCKVCASDRAKRSYAARTGTTSKLGDDIGGRVTWQPCSICGEATHDRVCQDCRQAMKPKPQRPTRPSPSAGS